MTKHTIYMIRHGEKPPKDKDGEDPVGLSKQGGDRAKYLPQIFGPQSPYNIGFIMAQTPKKSGKKARPYDTVKPLADSLGLEIDTSVDRDDTEGAAKLALKYHGQGNVLICWEHHELSNVAQAIGVKDFAPSTNMSGQPIIWPSRFDIIWTVPPPYNEVTSIDSEAVPGLDDGMAVKQD